MSVGSYSETPKDQSIPFREDTITSVLKGMKQLHGG